MLTEMFCRVPTRVNNKCLRFRTLPQAGRRQTDGGWARLAWGDEPEGCGSDLGKTEREPDQNRDSGNQGKIHKFEGVQLRGLIWEMKESKVQGDCQVSGSGHHEDGDAVRKST